MIAQFCHKSVMVYCASACCKWPNHAKRENAFKTAKYKTQKKRGASCSKASVMHLFGRYHVESTVKFWRFQLFWYQPTLADLCRSEPNFSDNNRQFTDLCRTEQSLSVRSNLLTCFHISLSRIKDNLLLLSSWNLDTKRPACALRAPRSEPLRPTSRALRTRSSTAQTEEPIVYRRGGRTFKRVHKSTKPLVKRDTPPWRAAPYVLVFARDR